MLTLYTPATGFPDLEAKIAYGLARVGIEAGFEFNLIPEKGYYVIEIKSQNPDPRKLNSAFLNILKRLLSSDRFFELGVRKKDKGKYSVKEETIKTLSSVDLSSLFSMRTISDLNIKKDMFCGHTDIPKFGGNSGLILISSFHAGKPYERDKRSSNFNQNLCAVCGYLAVLGLHSFLFNIQMGVGKKKKYVLVLPIPEKPLSFNDLQMLLSLQKTLHNYWLSNVLPLRAFLIGLLAKIPSISDIINNLHLFFHLTLFSIDSKGTTLEQTTIVDTIKLSKFISASPFNVVTVDKLLGNRKEEPKINSLIELASFLETGKLDFLCKFARLYVQETSTNNYVNLLYPKTAEYLLKEVAMIRPEIIQNPALQSLAKTLRYFIRERNYGYADSIRNARKESRDFEETIAKMLREAEIRRVQQEQDRASGKEIKNWVHIPNEKEIQEVFKLANEDFESTKLALVILAFSFPSKSDEI